MEVRINDFKLESDSFIGIVGDYNSFVNIFKDIDFSKNTIYIDKKRLTINEKKKLLKKVSMVEDSILDNYKYFTVYEYMKYSVIENMLHLKDYRKKIRDSLKIVGLSESYLDKKIYSLSYSEFKIISLARSLLSNPDIVIIKNFFDSFDIKTSKKMLNLFSQLIERYHKIIIFCSNNSEFIYKYTKKMILISDSKLVIQGNTDELYEENLDLLEKNNISIPKTVLFTNLVLRKKGVKLSYHKDIRDLIKDIYKKV